MPWVFLLLAIAAFAVAFKTTSVALLALCLMVALGLLLVWVFRLPQSPTDRRTWARVR